MKHFDEHTLDLYVLNNRHLPPETRSAIATHLEQCAACRGVVESMRKFYEEVDWQIAVHASDVDLIVQRLFPAPPLVRLSPVMPPDGKSDMPGSQIMALIGMSGDESNIKRFETVAEMASEHNRSVAGIQYDRIDESFKLGFHSEDFYPKEGVIVSIPGLHADFVLDERGQVRFALEREQTPADWRHLNALVRFPVASLRISLSEISEDEPVVKTDSSGMYRVECRTIEHRLHVSATAAESALPVMLTMVKGTPGETTIAALTDGKIDFASDALPNEFELRLYQ